jgi:phospholipid/cholesterol/gamma-HCH transport system ATP-binding protein
MPLGSSLGVSSAEAAGGPPRIHVVDLTMAYGDFVIQRDLNFSVAPGEIFVIMGASGCGKSTLLRHLIGLIRPAKGDVLFDEQTFWGADDEQRQLMTHRFGVLYQSGALWSSMTLAENIGLPLGEFSDLTPAQIREVAALKLALVGLGGFEDFYPAEISGGMQKRAGLARAMALDPDILFLDEPSAGLDPVSSRLLDDLILALRANLNCTVVAVTHELASIFTIADNSIYLDAETRTMLAQGNPRTLLAESKDPKIHAFLTRGGQEGGHAPAGAASGSAAGGRVTGAGT